MHELTRRVLSLYRTDPTLAFTADPFQLYTAGLKTKDLPDAWSLPFAMECIQDARRLFREEVDRDAQGIRSPQA